MIADEKLLNTGVRLLFAAVVLFLLVFAAVVVRIYSLEQKLKQVGEKERRVTAAEATSLDWSRRMGLGMPVGQQCGIVDSQGRVFCTLAHRTPDTSLATTYLWCTAEKCITTETMPVPE